MKLSGFNTEKLFEALLDAYRDYGKLERMVRFKLGENLARYSGKGNLEDVVYDLIDSAEATGKLERLIVGAYEQNPNNLELKKFYETVFINYKQRAILDADVIRSKDFGPDIDWRGGTDEIELQSFFRSQPNWYDVGFLQRIIEQSKSVCRVDVPALNVTATGVVIAQRYLLTNYHVFKGNDYKELDINVENVSFNFGHFSLSDGQETKFQSFRLNSEQPVIAFSPVENLDYILLQLEETFTLAFNSDDATIKPARWSEVVRLSKADGINILQHPNGESMKLSITCDGITGIYHNDGLIQYINKTAGGSSGSPCFNENGELVALHHAQRSKYFGTIREGILFSSIYQDLIRKSVQVS